MGSEKTEFDVIFDNSSDWLALEGSDCETCEGNKYDPSTSTDNTMVGVDFSQRTYGTATMTGREHTD